MTLHVELPRRFGDITEVTVNGRSVAWRAVAGTESAPRIEFEAPAASRQEISVSWAGEPVPVAPPASGLSAIVPVAFPTPTGPFETVDLTHYFNDRVTQIFKNEYRSPRSPFVSLAIPKQGLGAWAGGIKEAAEIDDGGLRTVALKNAGRLVLPSGLPFATPGAADAPNVVFTSQWDNYPREKTIPLTGRARRVWLLMAGSTNWMQSRLDNGEVVITYRDGSTDRLALENPTTWWPIEQDYFTDDFAFRRSGSVPSRIELRTGKVYVPANTGGKIAGGAATVLGLTLDPAKELSSVLVRTLSNEVVIGLLSLTLERD
jgi:hypothetical protein